MAICRLSVSPGCYLRAGEGFLLTGVEGCLYKTNTYYGARQIRKEIEEREEEEILAIITAYMRSRYDNSR